MYLLTLSKEQFSMTKSSRGIQRTPSWCFPPGLCATYTAPLPREFAERDLWTGFTDYGREIWGILRNAHTKINGWEILEYDLFQDSPMHVRTRDVPHPGYSQRVCRFLQFIEYANHVKREDQKTSFGM